MRLPIIVALGVCLGLVPVIASAQSGAAATPRAVTALGYAFGGVGAATGGGGSEATMHFGGGFEALVRDAIGAGAEFGYLAPFSGVGDGIFVLSMNGYYHFSPGGASHGARPFVTGGYSLALRDGHESLWNLGGGVDYWFTPKKALRIEVRDHVWPGGGYGAVHFWGGRVALVLR